MFVECGTDTTTDAQIYQYQYDREQFVVPSHKVCRTEWVSPNTRGRVFLHVGLCPLTRLMVHFWQMRGVMFVLVPYTCLRCLKNIVYTTQTFARYEVGMVDLNLVLAVCFISKIRHQHTPQISANKNRQIKFKFLPNLCAIPHLACRMPGVTFVVRVSLKYQQKIWTSAVGANMDNADVPNSCSLVLNLAGTHATSVTITNRRRSKCSMWHEHYQHLFVYVHPALIAPNIQC